MSGPCLCGDPYCGSCFPGNDGGAFEEFILSLEEELSKLDEEQCRIFVEAGRAAVAKASGDPFRILVEQDYFDCAGGRWIARCVTAHGEELDSGYGDTMQEAVRDVLTKRNMKHDEVPIYVPASREIHGHGTG